MSRVLQLFPNVSNDEQIFLEDVMRYMNDDQIRLFAESYRAKRRDQNIVLVLTLLGFVMVAGMHRFYLGHIAMGLLYLFTGGLFAVGTIYDLLHLKDMVRDYNRQQADHIALMVHQG